MKCRSVMHLRSHDMAKNEGDTKLLHHPRSPTTAKIKLGSGKLELLDSGLAVVRLLLDAQESSYEKQLLSVLEKVGMAKPLKSIWQWQDPQICEEFIRNWNHKTRITTVLGIRINTHMDSFLTATGLKGDNLYRPSTAQAASASNDLKYGNFCGADLQRWGSRALLINDLKNETVRHLLTILSRTLWLGPKKRFHLSKAAVYLLVEALEGNVLGWGRCIHERFISLMTNLHHLQRSNSRSKQQTVAGPLMCFLYAHARDLDVARNGFSPISKAEFERIAGKKKREAASRASEDVGEGKAPAQPCKVLELPPPAPNELSRKRPRDGVGGLASTSCDSRTGAPSSSADQAQGPKSSEPPSTPDHPSQRQCRGLSSYMDTDLSSGRSQEVVELTAEVGRLTGKLERKEKEVVELLISQEKSKEEVTAEVGRLTGKLEQKEKEIVDLLISQEKHKQDLERMKNEISQLQRAENDFNASYEGLHVLCAKEVKNVRDLTEKVARQRKEILDLTVAQAASKREVVRFERLYDEEKRHSEECLKLHFAAATTEDEVGELRERVRLLAHQWRESRRNESFLELQLADMRRRWDREFPVRKELIGIEGNTVVGAILDVAQRIER